MNGDEFVTQYVVPAMVCLGVPLLIASGVSAAWSARLVARGLRAAGTVIRVELERSTVDTERHSHTVWLARPIVVFTTRDGRQVEVRSNVAHSFGGFAVGDPVQVLYAPGYPEAARLDTFWTLAGPALALGVLGAGFLLFAWLLVTHL